MNGLVKQQFSYTESARGLFTPIVPARFYSLLRPAGGKALAAQHGSSARRLERHRVGLAALVTGDFETLALAARAPSSAAEVGAPRIAASLAALRLTQVSFRVILLLAFGEWKRVAALGTSDLYVWHV